MNESAEPQIKDIEASVISDEERDLAENALFDFQKGAYTLCLSYLNKLEALRPKDLKVMHNKVVAEYYKSDLKKTELVKKSLNAICGQLLSTDAADAADVVEKCVMRYNQAILLYHTKQYNAALQIMSRLFSLIEPLVSEESLAQKVCLLLIELYIATVQPDAALSLVNYIERQFAVSDISKISSTDKEGLIKPAREQKELKKDSADIADDAFRMRLTKCKIRIYLLTNQLKLCKKEWKAFATMGSNMNLSNIFLAANVEYLRGKCKKAITLLNASTPEQRGFKCSKSLFKFETRAPRGKLSRAEISGKAVFYNCDSESEASAEVDSRTISDKIEKLHTNLSKNSNEPKLFSMKSYLDSITLNEQTRLYEKFARAVYGSGASIDFFENKYWENFFQKLRLANSKNMGQCLSTNVRENILDNSFWSGLQFLHEISALAGRRLRNFSEIGVNLLCIQSIFLPACSVHN